MPSIKQTYVSTLKSLKDNRSIYLPFVIFALIDFITLMLIYWSPRQPFIIVFGPPIRTLWHERFLHYPSNFLLLPKLLSLSRMVLAIIFGSLLTGLSVAILYKKPLKTAFKKYTALFLIVFLITVIFYGLTKILSMALLKYFMAGHAKLLFLKAKLWLGPVITTLNFLIALIVQAAFIYAVPIVIISEEKFIKAILQSFVFFKKNFIATLILVGIPMLLYIPIMILNDNTAFLIDKFFPELILWIVFLGSVISSLIVDPLVTISTALRYLHSKERI